jgi:hypothetical protein
MFYWFARVGYDCALTWRFQAGYTPWIYYLHSIPGFVLLGMLNILLGWKYLKIGPNKDDNVVSLSIRQQIENLCPVIVVPRTVALILSSGLFIYFSWFFFQGEISLLARPVACVADELTNYELAERIFRIADRVPFGESLAGWQAFRVETESVRDARNIAVAKVYGSNSLELADRHEYVGESISARGKPGQSDEAIFWLEKSLPIYGALGASESSIDTLNQIAIIRSKQKNRSKLQDTLLQASKLLDNQKKSVAPLRDRGQFRRTLLSLSNFAKHNGDDRLANLFVSKKIDLRIENYSSFDTPWFLLLFATLVTTLYFDLIPNTTRNEFEEFILSNRYKRTNQLYLQGCDLLTSIEGLSAMTTIDLYRGKLKRAWENSVNALTLVGVNTEKSNTFYVEYPPSVSQKILAMRVHSLVFTLFFILTFFH